MERHKQFTPLITVTPTFEPFNEPDHTHNHYEIIYIKSGRGRHFLNGEMLQFEAGSLFLIDPYDIHHFETDEKTEFVIIKFTESFIQEKHNLPTNWTREFKYMVASRSLHNYMFCFNSSHSTLIKHLFESVVAAQDDHDIIYLQLLAILEVVKRTIAARKEIGLHPSISSDGKMEELLSYIHQNITTPSLLKIENLSKQFRISNHYVSSYFKRNMGLTLRQYIDNYRMALIQNRLTHSDFTIKEIAYDFGFTDESHLNKVFKKYWSMSAKAYREQNTSTSII